MFTVMTSKKSITKGNYTYSLMGADTIPTHVHINNNVTNSNSVIVPINDLMALFDPDEE